MGIELWISIALAIPLSILANLLTPRIQAWLDSRSKQRSLQRTHQRLAEIEEELTIAKSYRDDRAFFHEYLFSVIIKTTFLSAGCGIAAIALSVIPTSFLHQMAEPVRLILDNAVKLLAFLFLMLIVSISAVAIRRINQVRYYDSFKPKAEAEVARLKAKAGGDSAAVPQDPP